MRIGMLIEKERPDMSSPLPASTSRREQRRRQDLQRRRSDILAAASSVFAAKGFHDAQMTEIAAAAEVEDR
jgi:AcrR family transcriptional regulator